MGSTAVSDLDAMLKVTFNSGSLENFAKRKSPIFRQIPQLDKLYGTSAELYFNTSMGSGASHTYANAKANAVTGAGYKMDVTRAKLYGVVDMEAEAMLAASKDMGSYLNLITKNVADRAMELEQVFCRELFLSSSTVAIGTITAASGSGPYDVTVSEGDIINFYDGQRLNIDDTSSGASPDTSIWTVSRVNYSANTMRLTVATAGSQNPSTTWKYLIPESDAAASVLKGFGAWLTGGTPDTLFGLDRTPAPAQLCGFGETVSATIEEAAKNLARKVLRFADITNTALVLSSANWQKLENELGSRVRRDDAAEKKFGTSAISLSTPGGAVACIADPFANDSYSYMLDLNTWQYWGCGPLPHIIGSRPGEDGNYVRKKESTDAYTIEWRGLGNLVCTRPINNGRLTH